MFRTTFCVASIASISHSISLGSPLKPKGHAKPEGPLGLNLVQTAYAQEEFVEETIQSIVKEVYEATLAFKAAGDAEDKATQDQISESSLMKINDKMKSIHKAMEESCPARPPNPDEPTPFLPDEIPIDDEPTPFVPDEIPIDDEPTPLGPGSIPQEPLIIPDEIIDIADKLDIVIPDTIPATIEEATDVIQDQHDVIIQITEEIAVKEAQLVNCDASSQDGRYVKIQVDHPVTWTEARDMASSLGYTLLSNSDFQQFEITAGQGAPDMWMPSLNNDQADWVQISNSLHSIYTSHVDAYGLPWWGETTEYLMGRPNEFFYARSY